MTVYAARNARVPFVSDNLNDQTALTTAACFLDLLWSATPPQPRFWLGNNFADGVNLAALLEGLAEPGWGLRLGVCGQESFAGRALAAPRYKIVRVVSRCASQRK